ncbi:MAG TPA: circadian clock protein KaiC [Anaerolineales bacterium]|nr:circadian clock protein KaiC [Anaerolineales bacterium]HNE05099.1 circadian clock protein KaiC [Anaerolineales bacterium]HNM37043.1 circadian clock protein KaiC [Anaerolineales bacterium]
MATQTLKTPTKIKGLDEVLNGGVPTGGLTLLNGGPGTGKTLFGLEFLVRGAQEGIPGILITFEEHEEALHHYATTFGWNTAMLEKQGLLSIIGARFDPEGLLSGDFDLGGILAILRHKTEKLSAKQVVIDAPDVFLRLLDNRGKERAELYKLINWLRDEKLTALMTVKADGGDVARSDYEFLDYLADCVIQLDQRVIEQVTTRRVRVVKYRGSAHGRNEYPFAMTDQGIWIIPITETQLNHAALGAPFPTGVAGLDAYMSGGYLRASCNLVTGTSGTGKTTFAASFARTSAANGKRVFYINFEESPDSMVSCMLSPGIDLRPAMEDGSLRFLSVMPEAQGIEEHLIQAFRGIEELKPDIVIVDAISACRRMGSRNSAFDYLLRLIDHCKTIGITSLLTNLTDSVKETQEITGIDLSSMIDTVVILRNVEYNGQFQRELSVLKARGRQHSNKVHKFQITDHGVSIVNSNIEDAHDR